MIFQKGQQNTYSCFLSGLGHTKSPPKSSSRSSAKAIWKSQDHGLRFFYAPLLTQGVARTHLWICLKRECLGSTSPPPQPKPKKRNKKKQLPKQTGFGPSPNPTQVLLLFRFQGSRLKILPGFRSSRLWGTRRTSHSRLTACDGPL